MTIPFQCGTAGNGQVIQINTVNGGNAQSIVPNFGAQSIPLSFSDCQQIIQEGMASGSIKPFNISGSTSMK